MKTVSCICLIAALLLTSGCLTSDETYSINPDGSGKVELRFTNDESSTTLYFGTETLEGEAKIRHVIAEMIKESKGVSGWADISYQENENGSVVVSATAYFDHINTLDLKYSTVSLSGYGVSLDHAEPAHAKLRIGADQNENSTGTMDTHPEISEERIQQEIAKQQAEFEQGWPFIKANLSRLNVVKRFRIAGVVEARSGFSEEDGFWVYRQIGEELIERIEAAKNDPVFTREAAIRSIRGADAPNQTVGLNQFAEMEPNELSLRLGSEPVFDYASEFATATANFAPMMTAIGMERNIPGLLPAAEGEGFDRFELGGLRLTKDLGLGFHARPFNIDPGITLSFVGYFNGRILGFKEGFVESAIDQKNRSVLPENEWNRKIHHGSLNEISDIIVFEVPLKLHDDSLRLEEVSGYIEYFVATKSETIDLGFDKIVKGAEGSMEGSLIKKVGKSQWNEQFEFELQLPLNHTLVKTVRAFHSNGTIFELQDGGSNWSGDQVTLTFRSETPIPEDLDLELERFTNVQKLRAPFSYENIDIPAF